MGAPPVHGVFEQHIHCFLKPSRVSDCRMESAQTSNKSLLGGRSLRPFRLNFVPSDSGCSPVGILNGKKGGCDWAQTKPGEPFLPTESYSGLLRTLLFSGEAWDGATHW